MHDAEFNKSGHTITLLFLFLFGALMTLLYLPPIKAVIPQDEAFCFTALAALVFISSLLASSLNGVVLLPASSLLFGCVAALEVDRVRELMSSGLDFWLEAALLVLLLPLYFLICSWGMWSSSNIRVAMGSRQTVYRKNKFISYAIVLVGAAVFAAAQGVMKI